MKVFYLQKSQVPKQCLCNMIWIGVFTLYTIEILVKRATDDVFQNDRWDLVKYLKTSYISRTLVGYKIVDNSACRRCSNYIFILNLTPGFNGFGKDHCKRR